jgi:hypothetical protein
MDMNELQIQRYLYKAVVDGGGFGMKMSHQFSAGVPDLLLAHPNYPPFVVEVKFIKQPNRYIPISTTPKQKNTLKKMKEAGIHIGVVVVVRSGRGYLLLGTSDPDLERFDSTEDAIYKNPGDPWPMLSMMERLWNEQRVDTNQGI